ncbi:hypothetical protein FRZ61_25190 [Hypericibacter adhaerens]|uniref:Uncharacterized protein n=1 Tax=Hypericibacter adhaerens TaxID=2602016 RepID=A0A5J6MZK3_9PROT|nr:hypothetical protein FRZ61_25190 [Hypericibacter adhaerens]
MELAERVVDPGQDPRAGLGQDQPLLGPLEQRNAQRILEQADLLADGRGRHMQLAGGLNQAAMAGGSPKGTQGVERRKSSGSRCHQEPPEILKNLLFVYQLSSD